MIFDGYHFIYGEFKSREHGLVFGHCDTSEFVGMIGSTTSSNVFNRHNMRRYFIRDNYADSPVSLDVELVTDGAYYMTLQERRDAERELFYRPGYTRLYVDLSDDDMAETYEIINGEQKAFYLNCRFTNPEKIIDGTGITVGYKCTMECDSPMFTQDPIIVETEDASSGITVTVGSNLNEYVYPKVTFRTGMDGGNVLISNLSDGASRITGFAALPQMHTVTMNSETNYMDVNDYARMADRNFVRLLPGENTILVEGDVAYMKIEFSNRRFL